MGNKANWLIANFHTYSYSQEPLVKEKVRHLLKKTREKFENYYYADYIDSQDKDYENHFKIHLFNLGGQERMKKEFEKIRDENAELISDLTYPEVSGEPTLIDGVGDRLLACYGREVKDLLISRLDKKPSLRQMRTVLHYMFNQMNYGYTDEIEVYLPLIEDYSKKLPDNLKNQLKKFLQDLSKKI